MVCSGNAPGLPDKLGKARAFQSRWSERGKNAAMLAAMRAKAAQTSCKCAHQTGNGVPRMARMKFSSLALFLACSAALAAAAPAAESERQDLAQLQRLVDGYARKEATGLPGSVGVTVAPLDARLSLPHCPAPEAFMPPGGRLWGKSAVGVRCTAPVAWTVYANVNVEVNAEYVVTARPLAQGEAIGAQDVTTMRGDLARLPAGVVVDPAHALGKHMAMSLGAGQPLRRDMLRQPQVITQGQGVKLVSAGPGFQVSAEGRALGNAVEGQTVQVRGPSGQTVSGVARPGGIVEVRY